MKTIKFSVWIGLSRFTVTKNLQDGTFHAFPVEAFYALTTAQIEGATTLIAVAFGSTEPKPNVSYSVGLSYDEVVGSDLALFTLVGTLKEAKEMASLLPLKVTQSGSMVA